MISSPILPSHHSPKRAVALAGAFALFGIIILLRLFDRSVLQSGLAAAREQAQTQVAVKMNPFRGHIVVQGNTSDPPAALALNEPRARVDVVPRNIKDKQKVSHLLAPLLQIDEGELFDKINNDKPYIPTLKRDLALPVGAQIDALKLTGVTVSNEAARTYPEGKMAAQLLGFVNGEGSGQYGVEGYYDSLLQGFSSQVTGTRDGWGNTFIDKTNITNNKGSDIVVTLDRDVQAIVEDKLAEGMDKFKAKSGSVTVVDPKTGHVLAMASAPGFDPNKFNEVKAEDQGNFKNLAITRTFEPGSVMKGVSVAAALDAGKVKPDEKNTYGSSVMVDNHEIHTATNKAFGTETPYEVLANSDNVALVDYSARLGRELEYDYMSRFGFGKKTGIDLDTEASGSLPELRDWRAINVATISFGQGIAVTALQMTMAYAALANQGVYMQPSVAEATISPDGVKQALEPKPGKRIISEAVASDITKMLIGVVVNGHGKKAGVKGYDVAGKTGTAQIANPDGSGYLDGKNNGSFAGYAPAFDPKFAMFVTFEEPQGVEFAESSAAPIWGEIATELLHYWHVPPKQ